MRFLSFTQVHHKLCKSSQDLVRSSATVQGRPDDVISRSSNKTSYGHNLQGDILTEGHIYSRTRYTVAFLIKESP